MFIAQFGISGSLFTRSSLQDCKIQNIARKTLMIAISQIEALSQQITQKFQPKQIILFGSYAYGEPTEDSDVDLLVILPFEGHGVHKAIEIRNQVNSQFPLDLIVRTPEQLLQRQEMGDFFIQEILEKGRILYEANHARVD